MIELAILLAVFNGIFIKAEQNNGAEPDWNLFWLIYFIAVAALLHTYTLI